MAIQLELNFQYGISREQACILCHLSSECGGCCRKCTKNDCNGQLCSQASRNYDGKRWDTWMHLISTYNMKHLLRLIPSDIQKKYGINKLVRKK